jgi:hypothetical protein
MVSTLGLRWTSGDAPMRRASERVAILTSPTARSGTGSVKSDEDLARCKLQIAELKWLEAEVSLWHGKKFKAAGKRGTGGSD